MYQRLIMPGLIFGLFSILCSQALCAVIHVPADQPTIQDAISAARDGDTIMVAPGTYVENIDFSGKAVTLTSSHGAQATIIDGGQPSIPTLGSVITFDQQEGPDSILEGFTITNGRGNWVFNSFNGGGIFCLEASPIIRNNVIRDNVLAQPYGIFGGGIFCTGEAQILENLLKGNVAENGGGICCWAGDPVIERNIFQGNFALVDGGAIDCRAEAAPSIHDNLMQGNKAHGLGGGIGCEESAAPLITGNTLIQNITGTGTGPGWGGGIGCHDALAIITDNFISENSATRAGGAVFMKLCPPGFPVLQRNVMNDNIGMLRGGGLMITLCDSLYILNNTLYGNKSPTGGGIHYTNSTGSRLTNNTLFGNSDEITPGAGGGISVYELAELTITNTIFWKNAASAGPEIHIGSTSAPSVVTVRYCDVDGGQASVLVEPGCTLNWWAGNIDADPLFVDADRGDFHLRYTSPCKDQGTNKAAGLPAGDFEDDPRIFYGTADMGADEFHTHLYWTGDAAPGGTVEVKLVGFPGTSPVRLCIGADVLDPPIPSMWGDWYLAFPINGPVEMPPIPATGVLILPATVPGTAPPPYFIPLQAFIGPELTNLCVIN